MREFVEPAFEHGRREGDAVFAIGKEFPPLTRSAGALGLSERMPDVGPSSLYSRSSLPEQPYVFQSVGNAGIGAPQRCSGRLLGPTLDH